MNRPPAAPTLAAPQPPDRSDSPSRLIFGSGEMADRTRAFDWSRTSAGPVEQWPETLRTIVNTILGSRHPMFLWWGQDLIQFYNDAYRPSIREDKHPRALGQPGRECWPEIWPIIGPQIEAVMQRGEASWNEDQLVPIYRNGRLEDVYWTYGYSPVRHPDGRIAATLVVCTETTETVLGRRQLQRESERLASLFEQAPAFFAVLNGPDFVFERINRQYQELIGPRNLIGKAVRDAVPEAESQGFLSLLDAVYRTGVPHIGHNSPISLERGPSGASELRYLNFVYQPRREPDGAISGVIALGVDVTEGKRVQELLIQSEKLAAVGRLSSSIAHEINNPLESVTNLLYLAKAAAVSPEAIEYLSAAETELMRVSAIANQTLRFHRQASQPRPVKPSELIDNTLSLFHGRLVNSQVRLERRDRADRPLKCLDGEIRQVLSNLIGNAIDSMNATGGRLLLRSRNAHDWSTGRTGVVVTIADTGTGIEPQSLSRIFEAFFSTKGFSGTGLGLWVSQEIVTRHQGRLTVRSRTRDPHRGTVFTLFLPCEDAASHTQPVAGTPTSGLHRG